MLPVSVWRSQPKRSHLPDEVIVAMSRPFAMHSDGRLRVTVAVTTSTSLSAPNRLVQLQFDAGTNTNVQIPGQATRIGPFTYNVPNQPTSFEFFVGRLGPGATRQPFKVIDGCSSQPWKTFVGGGATAF
jgi:hypothetical protein